MLVYDNFEVTITVEANSNIIILIQDNYTIPSGYKIVGCIPMFRSNNGVTLYAVAKLINYGSNGIPQIIVINSSSSSYTWTLECRLFMIKA